MKKIHIEIVVAIVFIVLAATLLGGKKQTGISTDYKKATYTISGEKINLGVGTIGQDKFNYFGNEVRVDLNSDGLEDFAFLITQETEAGNIFYFVVAAIKTKEGYVGSEGVLLGDRIAPQTTEVRDGLVLVNYAVRPAGENTPTSPSSGKSIWLKFDPVSMQFGEVVQGFEGEADPSRMKIDMKRWEWVSTLYNDGKKVAPPKAKIFTIVFRDDGNFSATTDCNSVGGEYKTSGNKIVLSNIISTLMYCKDSQEGEFVTMLEQIDSYHFTSKGELIFDLKLDSGSAIFR